MGLGSAWLGHVFPGVLLYCTGQVMFLRGINPFGKVRDNLLAIKIEGFLLTILGMGLNIGEVIFAVFPDMTPLTIRNWMHMTIYTCIFFSGFVPLCRLYGIVSGAFFEFLVPVALLLMSFMFAMHENDSMFEHMMHNLVIPPATVAAVSRLIEVSIDQIAANSEKATAGFRTDGPSYRTMFPCLTGFMTMLLGAWFLQLTWYVFWPAPDKKIMPALGLAQHFLFMTIVVMVQSAIVVRVERHFGYSTPTAVSTNSSAELI
eukprot:gnl/Spiro4/4777_TR2396_c0_g1_i1.p1 gnl/Spiro4/4777_TR2396_c0_g1~~gnl/Spiro4/4777_TR2396_c0_g1_i1.p1  ORF type:complete len:275 (-),score=63.19 gnl/Spiro4/4777_TR2396_c0_g1_i1:53-832(-)